MFAINATRPVILVLGLIQTNVLLAILVSIMTLKLNALSVLKNAILVRKTIIVNLAISIEKVNNAAVLKELTTIYL